MNDAPTSVPRILVIDDNRAIHNDFRKILCPSVSAPLEDLETELFGPQDAELAPPVFEMDSAYQGQEGLAMLEQSLQDGCPYWMAFVDVRMPPGWDGVETISRLWQAAPDLQVVICTAYSDYSWSSMTARLQHRDRLVILKKPFDAVEVLQLAAALTEKWRLLQQSKLKMAELETIAADRTRVLRQTNEILREQAALLNLASDAILVRDLSGKVRFWNKGAERLYGWSAARAIGDQMAALFPNQDKAAIEAAERALLARGEWTGEFRKHIQSGQEGTVSSRWTLLRDEHGQPCSVLIIDTDITEKKRLEAQFLRAQRIEGIGTLATGMAHDLNNILAPILMSAGYLRWDIAPEEREEAISRIELSVKRGAEIIQQVLTFGRGINGERVAVKPADLLAEVAQIVGQTFPKDIILAAEIPANLGSLMGDRTQIHQVLLNLCVNARDSMPNGGQLSLRARAMTLAEPIPALPIPAQPGSYLVFEVADTGCGIPAADHERIFDPFFTTKEVGKGTGLGLSSALGIVQSHRGVIVVESEVGRGTTFKVFFPAPPGASPQDTARVHPPPPRGAGEVILIVDDEPDVLAGMRQLLQQHNYQVLTAVNGEEALDIIGRRKQRIDAILTDIMMPEMDGMALIRAVRVVMPELKIIASSGLGPDMGGSPRAQELKSLGVASFLHKPYSMEMLLHTLHELFGGSSNTVRVLRQTV